MSMRMVQLKATVRKIARLVRDLARRRETIINFIPMGEDTEIDRNMVDLINDPLVRSGAGALRAGLDAREPVLVALSAIRTGLPRGTDEANGGDGAVAFLCAGDGQRVIAEYLGSASTSAEFLDRWRLPVEATSRAWEERFGEYVYVPLAQQAFQKGLETVGVTTEHIDHLIVTGVHPRAARTIIAGSGVRSDIVANDLGASVGNAGGAHLGLMLADVLDRALRFRD